MAKRRKVEKGRVVFKRGDNYSCRDGQRVETSRKVKIGHLVYTEDGTGIVVDRRGHKHLVHHYKTPTQGWYHSIEIAEVPDDFQPESPESKVNRSLWRDARFWFGLAFGVLICFVGVAAYPGGALPVLGSVVGSFLIIMAGSKIILKITEGF